MESASVWSRVYNLGESGLYNLVALPVSLMLSPIKLLHDGLYEANIYKVASATVIGMLEMSYFSVAAKTAFIAFAISNGMEFLNDAYDISKSILGIPQQECLREYDSLISEDPLQYQYNEL